MAYSYERDVRKQRFRVRYWVIIYIVFFSLEYSREKLVDSQTKCRENGIDRLQNRQLLRRSSWN